MSQGYVWLYPKAGGFAIFRMVDDYEKEKADGFSIYPDCRDLYQPEPVAVIPDSAPVVADENKAAAEFTCEICGKEVSSKLALVGHLRSHK